MKIILLQDVRGVGRKYDVKEVSDGYARNFIIPRKLGKVATSETLRELKTQKENWEKQIAVLDDRLKKLQGALTDKPLIFKLKLGENQKAFGSVSKKDIEEKLRESDKNLSFEVNLNQPIKTLGEHQVKINLNGGVSGNIKIKVEKE
ncbi:MAG: 50S ribosomal protein L9 [Parcubacteria group bacterium CG1_02_42_13]|uniref:Large ribosomal subunit protein bL9 n=1 Tax=Candidatus Colwellbacteria bacterium CG23_combo_of_CG06-09_8_20_14_all_42_19 TaxID=1974541 RepID=A0A2H0AL49_9BACT|nr:MAG: 50S ribosomal protein L9 [Parcubacteria group bacterium CG1_02_42_13]PIP46142.1 MAG: 50S ribosomal protein L9 [Candidatus Colwellbacteria bacterium CG23_combo_of_CG06-09_8_20_14_all_42_19]